MFSLICVWISSWVNNHEAGDFRRHHGHYDVNVMLFIHEYVFENVVCKMVAILFRGYEWSHYPNQWQLSLWTDICIIRLLNVYLVTLFWKLKKNDVLKPSLVPYIGVKPGKISLHINSTNFLCININMSRSCLCSVWNLYWNLTSWQIVFASFVTQQIICFGFCPKPHFTNEFSIKIQLQRECHLSVNSVPCYIHCC